MMKGRLSWLLIYVLPLFPITYSLGLTGVFNRDQVIASNMICSVFAKLVFVGILSLESLFVQLAQRGTDSRKKALNHATLEGFSLRGRTAKGKGGPFGVNLNPKYDSLNQVSSVEDEVNLNFNLVRVENKSSIGVKPVLNGGKKSASDGPLASSPLAPPSKIKGTSTGKLHTNF